jgi:hypothetical protein
MQISHEAAAEQAIQLFKQNVKYDDIAVHLKKIGYVSSRTRKPITGQAARWMVMEELKKRGEVPERNVATTDTPKPTLTTDATVPKDDTIWVTPDTSTPTPAPISGPTPAGDILTLRIVLDLDIPDAAKLKLVKALVG